MNHASVKYLLGLMASLFLIMGFGSALASDMKINATEATQIGKHDAKDRFCYDGSCVIHGEGKIDIKSGSGN